MRLRIFSPRTQREYLRVVRVFCPLRQAAAEQLGTEQVREYLLDMRRLVSSRAQPATVKVYRAALRFFYESIQGRPEVVAPIGSPKVPRKLPQVLSGMEVEELSGAIGSLKYRAVVMTTYAAGFADLGGLPAGAPRISTARECCACASRQRAPRIGS